MKYPRRRISVLSVLPLLLVVGSPWAGCGPGGTGTGNPLVSLEVQPYSPTSASAFELIRTAEASVATLKFCFKRLRFKTSTGSVGTDQDIRSMGEVTISASGTSLGSVSVPAGDYAWIEFDLDNQCASGKSVQLMNDAGSFSTTDSITLRFQGSFNVSSSTSKLKLGIQAIIKKLDAVASDGAIKTGAEGDTGDVSD